MGKFANKKMISTFKYYLLRINVELKEKRYNWGERKVIRKEIIKEIKLRIANENINEKEFEKDFPPKDMVIKYQDGDYLEYIKKKAKKYNFARNISIIMAVILAAVLLYQTFIIFKERSYRITDEYFKTRDELSAMTQTESNPESGSTQPEQTKISNKKYPNLDDEIIQHKK